MVDLGGSLAVASMGLYATGVTTDMNSALHIRPPQPTDESGWLTLLFPVTYLSSGGKIGETIRGSAVCEKSKPSTSFYVGLKVMLTLA